MFLSSGHTGQGEGENEYNTENSNIRKRKLSHSQLSKMPFPKYHRMLLEFIKVGLRSFLLYYNDLLHIIVFIEEH